MVRYYGVKEKLEAKNSIDMAAEELRIVGYTVVESGYSKERRDKIAHAFERSLKAQADANGGLDFLRSIDEHNTIRAPLIYDDEFIELAQNPNILALATEMMGGSHTDGTFILNQQNGIINPGKEDYNQAYYHRDLPYQHFTSSRPLAINALYCIDNFSLENGATKVVPGSHKFEAFPSNATVEKLEETITAVEGTFLVLDCMVYHSGGENKTNSCRRAVNHVYTLPMIRQQLPLPDMIPNVDMLPKNTRQLFGCSLPYKNGLNQYYKSRKRKDV